MQSRTSVLVIGFVAIILAFAGPATAAWGPNSECEGRISPTNKHCYAYVTRNIQKFGGVLASIDFVDTDYNTYPTVEVPKSAEESFVTMEEWIQFPGGPAGFIETGQEEGIYGTSGAERVVIHPFYAEEQSKVFKHEFSELVVPAGGPAFEKAEPYNHYVLYDSEKNGRWHIYWGCCEVGYYGGGWPVYLTEQKAGLEAGDASRPKEYGRHEVAASDGGEWTPWSGSSWQHQPAICIEANEESHAEGNIEYSTLC
jgi:hypothetical protein